MTRRRLGGSKLTAWSLVALSAGLALGLLAQFVWTDPIRAFAGGVRPLGTVWINALQMTVIPLVVTQILAALMTADGARHLGSLGGRTLALFCVMLVGAGALTLLLTPLGLAWYRPDPVILSALQPGSVPDAALNAAQGGRVALGDYLVGMIPRNPFEAAATGDLLPLLVFTVLVGAAASRLPAERLAPLSELVQSAADAMMVLIGWVLWGTPIGVFALILAVTVEAGSSVVGFLGAYVVGVSALLILVTLLLYPVTALFGRTSLGRFARTAAPAQLVAASTQSSLASLPALVEGARDRMGMSERGTGFVLPLAVSTFKLNQIISSPFRFLFLAHVFGITLGAGELTTYMVAAFLLSFSTPGVPRGSGGFRKLPLYIAAGIPVEGYVLIEAVKTIPDVFMTTTNVTADMSAAVILTRDERAPAPAATPAPVHAALETP